MKRDLVTVYLSNALLLGFATGWLVLIFIPLLIATDHAMGLWYEDNLVILTLEAAVCIFSVTWAISQMIYTIKRRIRRMRLEVRENYVKA
ncbi:MAG: hypothetical protein KAT35_04965 [Candidatus Aenigmarchaeota archaeon]|nr:hypothetical protein [Candidatus Aenigmarchaeota archaeon]